MTNETPDVLNSADAGQEQAKSTHEKRRDAIMEAVRGAKLNTLQNRVAWILSREPKTRDSDIELQLSYWKTFHPDKYKGGSVAPELFYELTRSISLTRARAKIQNSYGLFLASPTIQAERRKLSESQRALIAAQRPDAPLITVAADETGKEGKHLIVGSVWMLASEQFRATMDSMRRFRETHNYRREFHFVDVKAKNIDIYKQLVDEVIHPAAAVSFRAVAVERAGLGNSNVDYALQTMFAHLLVRGVQKEQETGRTALPRGLEFWKDREDDNRDKLMLAAIQERVNDAAAGRFSGQLYPEEFAALDSKTNDLVQIADLFTASLNRKMNRDPQTPWNVKDDFATHLLAAVQMPEGPQGLEPIGDMTGLIAL
jgi:hypothetical protein